MSLLKINSLYKRFGKKEVVRGVDFSMETGEVLGLLGPNGAGKTTTFYMIVGFYRPNYGNVLIDEIENFAQYALANANMIGYCLSNED